MKTLQQAARAITQPVSLGCIALLILNDHYLKSLFPSFLTGKLSDFAGLFFFPFLLIPLLSILLKPTGLPPQRIAAGAYWLTLIWFAGLKTIALVNDWTEQAAGLLRGGPVRIVEDPTDLMALIVLIPSWTLWKRSGTFSERKISGRAVAAAVSTAVLGIMATSPCGPTPQLTRLVYFEGNLFGSFEETIYSDWRVVVTVDHGENWIATTNIPDEIAGMLVERQDYPEMICLETFPEQCYRITGGDQILRSEDGGETWAVDWEIPDARRGFMMRYDGGFLSCPKEVDFQVFDLAVNEDEQGIRIAAAMGNEGILVKENDSPWERKPVLQARPTPMYETDISQLFYLFYMEIGVSIFLGLVAFVILTIVILNRAIAAGLVNPGGNRMKIFGPFLWVLIPVVLIIAMFSDILDRLPGSLEVAAVYLIPLSLIVAVCASIPLPWKRAADLAGDPQTIYVARNQVLKIVFGGILVSWAGLAGWATGLLSWFWMAAVLGFVGIGYILFNGLQNIGASFNAAKTGSGSGSADMKD